MALSVLTRQAFMLGTLITLTVYDPAQEEVLEDCLTILRHYEARLSRFDEKSEVYALNHRISGKDHFALSQELFYLIERSLHFSRISGGGFDITTETLSSLWDVSGNTPHVPSKEEIDRAKAAVGWEKLRLEPESKSICFLHPNTRIDLGGIAKGYIADKLKEHLLLCGVNSAIINLGGNVLCLGKKPDGTSFRVGVQNPFVTNPSSQLRLDINDLSVVTSGVYQRRFIKNGRNYHHLMDPHTGEPFETGLSSVTILSPKSIDGDGLSTCCFALGLEKGLALLDTLDDISGIFITNDGQIYCSREVQTMISSD